MAISTSKTEIYAEGTTDISWTNLQSNLGAQEPTNIRFGTYKRTPEDTSETPLIPDADENADIGTEESGNLRVGAFRGAIKRHDVTFDNASEYENVQFDKYFGGNIVKNVPKNLNVDGIIYSNSINKPAARIDTDESVRNLTVGIGTSGAIYGAGGPSISEGPEGPIVQFNARYDQGTGGSNALISIPEGVTSITYTIGGESSNFSPSGTSGLLSDSNASYGGLGGVRGQKLSGTLTGNLGGQALVFRSQHFSGGRGGQRGSQSSTSTFTDNRSSLSYSTGAGFVIDNFYRTIDPSITSGTENHPVGTLKYFVEIADYADLDIAVFPLDDQRRASGLSDPDSSIEIAPGWPKKVATLSDRTRWEFAFQMNNSQVSGAKQATFVRNFAVSIVASGGSDGGHGGAAASISLENGNILALAGGAGGPGGNQVNGSENPTPTTTNVIRTTAQFGQSGCGNGADGQQNVFSTFNSGGGGAGGGCPAGSAGASISGQAQKGGAGTPGEGLYDASFHTVAPTVTTSDQNASYLEISYQYQDTDEFDGSIGVADTPISQNPACDSAILYGWYTRTTSASTNGTTNINQLVVIWNGEVVYNEIGSNINLVNGGVEVDGFRYTPLTHVHSIDGWHNDGTTCGTAVGNNSEVTNGFNVVKQAVSGTSTVEGITGGTALYVDSDSNTRNFKINLESTGGGFGKLYGGGGGGITGDTGTTDERTSCVRNQDNSYSYTQPRTCTGYAYNPPTPGNWNPTYVLMRNQPAHGIEQSRNWDWRAEHWCRTNSNGGQSFGGTPNGGRGYGHGYHQPGVRNGHPYFVEGVWLHSCNYPGFYNGTTPGTQYSYTYGCSQTITVPQSRSDAGTITSPGGLGGPGGKGQGYQRSFENGTAGGTPTSILCSSLGTLFSGPSVQGTDGSDGTSGGNWGEPGGDSSVATGGLAGYAYKKSNPSIDIEIIGGDENRLKGRNN